MTRLTTTEYTPADLRRAASELDLEVEGALYVRDLLRWAAGEIEDGTPWAPPRWRVTTAGEFAPDTENHD